MTKLAGTEMPHLPGHFYPWWMDDNAERINHGGCVSVSALTFEEAQAKLADTIAADRDRMTCTNTPGYWSVSATWFSVDEDAKREYPSIIQQYIDEYESLKEEQRSNQ